MLTAEGEIMNKKTFLTEEIKEFAKAMLEQANNKKNIKKGDSWKRIDHRLLRVRVNEENKEFNLSRGIIKEERAELLDIAICSMMLWHRLKNVEEGT